MEFAPSPCLPEETLMNQSYSPEQFYLRPNSKSFQIFPHSDFSDSKFIAQCPQNDFHTAKTSRTLLISNIPMYQLQELQQILVQCGPIKVLDTKRLSERFIYVTYSLLIVQYFEFKGAEEAYNRLNNENLIQVEYILDSLNFAEKTQEDSKMETYPGSHFITKEDISSTFSLTSDSFSRGNSNKTYEDNNTTIGFKSINSFQSQIAPSLFNQSVHSLPQYFIF